MKIGDNIRIIRDKKNISQQEIADFLGVERKTYINWEAGTTDIKSVYIPKLAKYLKVEINDLFRDNPTHNTGQKDRPMDGIVVLITDRDAIDDLMEIFKKRFDMYGY